MVWQRCLSRWARIGWLGISLHRLTVRIEYTEQLPKEWKEGVIGPVYKMGDKIECENYQLIIILNAVYKLLA